MTRLSPPVPRGQKGQSELRSDRHADPRRQQPDQHHPGCGKVRCGSELYFCPVSFSLLCSWCSSLCRVIQMIDQNKEQLRNLFRTYNVVDVQPAVGDKLPDDISTLQVLRGFSPRLALLWVLFWPSGFYSLFLSFSFFPFTAGHHHPGCAAVFGRNPVCNHELALSQSVRVLQSPALLFTF